MQEWLKDVVADANRLAETGRSVALQTIEFHPGLSCPLQCDFCHTSRNPNSIYSPGQRVRRILSLRSIKSLLEEFAVRGGLKLVLSGGLEPFMSNVAVGSLVAARTLGLQTSVYTSGLAKYLTEKSLPTVVESSGRMRFSVSAAMSETYRKVQAPQMSAASSHAAFKKVRALLASAAALSKSTETRVGAQFLVRKDNINEWHAALEYAASVGVHFFDLRVDIIPDRTLGATQVEQIAQDLVIEEKRFPEVKIEFRGPAAKPVFASQRCHAWRSSLVVDAFGGVHVCCVVADRAADVALFGFGYVQSGHEFADLVERLDKFGADVPQCRVCADRTRVFNALVEGAEGSDAGLSLGSLEAVSEGEHGTNDRLWESQV